jgi:hypothetical protein
VGKSLFDELLSCLGEKKLKKELEALVEKKGLDPKRMSLQELRDLVASYTRQKLLSMQSYVADIIE